MQNIFNVRNSGATDQEDSVDSCIDITSPTPSQSTCESSSSRSEGTGQVSGQRPPPLGCSASGSSEEGEKDINFPLSSSSNAIMIFLHYFYLLRGKCHHDFATRQIK